MTGDRAEADTTSATRAVHRIRDLIVRGNIAPGARLVEGELARRLHLSRSPTRSALQLLHQEGFVRVHQSANRVRIRVTPLTRSDASELYAVIGCLEGLAARAVASLDEKQRFPIAERMRGLNGRLADIPGDPLRHGDVFALDRDFHRVIVEHGAGARLQALHRSVEPQVERYRRLYASSIVHQLHDSIEEHDEIVDALVAGDPERLEWAVQSNWKNGAGRLGSIIDELGEHGSW
ncbi:MAG TPA: GntR family transcriptional regulator [Acidobacteriaceae bacterium]|nr:GntR family transcriptional regulator [Acidobacteriaceae bacterium]